MSRVGSGRVGHKISVFGGSGSVSKISDRYGATENAGQENDGQENDGQKCRAGKCRTGK